MRDTPMMVWWKTVNSILTSRGQPEMLFGEARDWWSDYQTDVANNELRPAEWGDPARTLRRVDLVIRENV